jgi:hypothetical protein
MEKHPHPFDDFLKESLKGHQLVPPEKAKKAFLEEASTILPFRKKWFHGYYLFILLIFFSGLIAVVHYSGKDETTQSAGTTSSVVISADTSASGKLPELSSMINPETINLPSAPVMASNLPIATIHEPAIQAISDHIAVISENINLPEDHPAGNSMSVPDTLIISTSDLDTAVDSIRLIKQGNDSQDYQDSVRSTSVVETTVLDTITEIVMSMPEKPASYFTAAISYLPEMMFNTLEGSKLVHNFSMEATYYRGLTSIRTGLGISVSQGITENAVQYNEFLGTYNKLDSISFTYNEATYDFYPHLHMSTEKVWDNATRLDSASIIKRYTYLQVPLVLGFDFWQKGRFTAGVRIGTVMSVMLGSKQITSGYYAGENLVVGYSKITPEQVKLNWQAIGGLNFALRLNRSLFIELEPQARYYYQSIYEKTGITKKPWSVGVRLAAVYKF